MVDDAIMNVLMVVDDVNGQGHVSRSTALREAMPPGWHVCATTIPRVPTLSVASYVHAPPDLIIVDDYRVDAALVAHWGDRCPVVVFDDGDWPRFDGVGARLRVQAHGGDGAITESREHCILRGHEYCPIRACVREAPRIDGMAVMLGGTIGADLVGERSWPSRPDLLVCAGGQTALEAAHIGVPSVIVTVAGNQNANARGLQDAGLARWFGTWEQATKNPGALAECVREMLADEKWRQHVADAGPKWIDGKGGRRIVEYIQRMLVTEGG